MLEVLSLSRGGDQMDNDSWDSHLTEGCDSQLLDGFTHP